MTSPVLVSVGIGPSEGLFRALRNLCGWDARSSVPGVRVFAAQQLKHCSSLAASALQTRAFWSVQQPLASCPAKQLLAACQQLLALTSSTSGGSRVPDARLNFSERELGVLAEALRESLAGELLVPGSIEPAWELLERVDLRLPSAERERPDSNRRPPA